MVNLLQRALRPQAGAVEQRFGWNDYAQLLSSFTYGGHTYGLTQTMSGGTEESIEANFSGLVQGALKRNGIVFACIMTRMLIFSEARFQFRRMQGGRPGDLFGDRSLRLLERPWPNGTTGDLLSRMLLDADLAGNAFLTVRNGRIKRLRPDWVTIVIGSESDTDTEPDDLDSELVGYIYTPGGPLSKNPAVPLLPEQVAHFAPFPDPMASYRGMSWLTPILREVAADSAATAHKLKFFENGATPNMVVTVDPSVSADAFRKFREVMDLEHSGLANAYRTLYLGGGAEAKVVGADMKQLDFKVTQGAGETRIAAAAGVPPVIVGLSEGLSGSSLNAGNYGQARRRLADGTIRPLWRNAAGSLATLVPPPNGAELWYDDRDIPFLREDRKDAAEIQQINAATIRQLIDAGYNPDSVIAAVEAEDPTLLIGQHSGLYSVQLQPPGTSAPSEPTPPEAGDSPDDATGE